MSKVGVSKVGVSKVGVSKVGVSKVGVSKVGESRWAAVVVNYEAGDALTEYVRSLRADTSAGDPPEVVVVDNGSRDGSIDALRAAIQGVLGARNPRVLGARNPRVLGARNPRVLVIDPYVNLG